MRVLALATDAFGGHGGVALYNRDLLTALCLHPSHPSVTAIPRLIQRPIEPLPDNLEYLDHARDSKVRFCAVVLGVLAKNAKFDLILCGHTHLLPVAEVARLWSRAPLLLAIYGRDAWAPTRRRLSNILVRRVDALVSIREHTTSCLRGWAGMDGVPSYILENAIHLERYGLGPKNEALATKYGLAGKRVVMTLGRVEEQFKGFDEVMDVLPDLGREIPDLRYLIVGGGHDLPRLKKKAQALGIADRVVFTGLIPESEKADHYRLADVFAMPGSAPDFDRYPLRFVFLEAMACGIPVVGCKPNDATDFEAAREVLSSEVDPFDRESIKAGIRGALKLPRGVVPEALKKYSFDTYTQRLHRIVDDVLERAAHRG